MDRQGPVVLSSAQKNARFILTNIVIMALAVVQIGLTLIFHDECDKLFNRFYIGIWVAVFVMCCFGILGTIKNIPVLLWIYLTFFGMSFIVVLVFVAMGFIVMMQSSGHHVDGLRFREYQLQDYSSWITKRLKHSHSWEYHFKKCYVTYSNCSRLSEIYTTREQYQLAELDPIESGCCRPPSECGYPAIDASYYNLSSQPTSSHIDCKLYKNSKEIKCFDCDSCKAGVAQYLKSEWKFLAIVYFFLLPNLLVILWQGCCVRRNVEKTHRKQASVYPHEIVQRDV